MSDIRSSLGRTIRELREKARLSQEALANRSKITYQYLSAVENGKENVSIGVLDGIASALGVELPRLFSLAAPVVTASSPPLAEEKYLRQGVPLPPGMETVHLMAAMNETQRIIHLINQNLLASGAGNLQSYIQGNNFSGLVSNMLCHALDKCSPYKHNSHQAYPDLICAAQGNAGLEVKSTINVGKGGESHNGHSGWHLIACFRMDEESGDIHFIHVMMADLKSHTDKNADWKYLGSRENPKTGNRRTETYTTNQQGTTKLRDGSVYLDTQHVDYSRWRPLERKRIPAYSIFSKTK